MAKYSSKDVVVEVDNSSGALVDLSQYVDTLGTVKKSVITEESHSFGDSDVEHFSTGVKRGDDIAVGGMYDDTATTGPHAILNAIGDTRTLKVTWGGAKTTSVETIIIDYARTPSRGAMTRYEATLRPTGAFTEV